MKMIKKMIAPVLTLTAVALLAGCGKESGVDVPDNLKEITATVRWWNNYQVPEITESFTEEQARQKSTYTEYYFAKDAIAAFNEIYPNITIETEYKGAYAAIASAVSTAAQTGDHPNLVSGYPDTVAGYVNAGISLDVTPYLQDEKVGFGKTIDAEGNIVDDETTTFEDFNQAYLQGEKDQYGGDALYSLPFSKSAETMAINKSVFDKVGAGEAGTSTGTYAAPVSTGSKQAYSVPTTWNDLMDLAQTMLDDYPEVFADNIDEDGLFTAVPVCYDSAENMFITFLYNLGIDYTANADTVIEQVLFNNDDAKKMVVQLKKWNNAGLLATQNQLYYSNKASGYHQYSSTMVASGTCFVAFSSTAGASYFAADGMLAQMNETPLADRRIVGETVTSTKQQYAKVISQGPSLAFLTHGDSVEDLATWLFYKHLTNTENCGKLSAAKSYIPIRTTAYQTEEVKTITSAAEQTITEETAYKTKVAAYTGQTFNLNTAYKQNDRYIYTPVFKLSAACRTAGGNLITTVFNDKDAKTDAEIEALVEQAFTTAYQAVVTNA